MVIIIHLYKNIAYDCGNLYSQIVNTFLRTQTKLSKVATYTWASRNQTESKRDQQQNKI